MFNQNLMNSIGVDFKLKTLEVDGKSVKLQIVCYVFIFSGYRWSGKVTHNYNKLLPRGSGNFYCLRHY